MRSIRGLYVIRCGAQARSVGAGRGGSVRADTDAADDGRLGTLVLDFSRFDTWYEINSWWEGRFLERTARGAFKRTIKNNGPQVKTLFDHGFDFQIGDKILGVHEVLEERPESPHMEVPLLDTSYNRDLLPGLAAGGYGSSFMFEVIGESWNRDPGASEHNPEGLPERTLTEVRLFEAGPVTWPANPDATAGLRSASGTDWLVEQLRRRDVGRHDQLMADLQAFRARYGLRTPSIDGLATPPEPDIAPAPAPGLTPARHVDTSPAARRASRLRALHLETLRRRSNAHSSADSGTAGRDPAGDGAAAR